MPNQYLARQRTLLLVLVPTIFLVAASSANRFSQPMEKQKRTFHAASRLTYGPTPSLLAEMEKQGIEKWIERQLRPESIAENPQLEARLAELETLQMSTEELARKYPTPAQLAAIVRQGRVAEITDPVLRARVQRYLDSRKGQAQQQPRSEEKQSKPLASDDALRGQMAGPNEQLEKEIAATNGRSRKAQRQETKRGLKDTVGLRELLQELTPEQREQFRGGPEQRIALLKSLPELQRENLMAGLPAPLRQQLLLQGDTTLRRQLLAAISPNQVVYHDLAEAKILRATYSNRQLEEMLVDFWFNHFNVYFDKGIDRVLVTSYERDAIRPHVLGKFEDLLLATAKHPAMLFYLDNWTSISAEAADRLAKRRRTAGPKRAQGLNENYARELLELHTLGVDGGYTQQDVVEVARCFTGWSISDARQGGKFQFREVAHDRGEKVVLGHRISGGGIQEGEKVIALLSRHPATAKFISFKLAQRFVADAPPPKLVESMAKSFLKSGGELREVMRTMLQSKEFWSQDAYQTKLKMPLESLVSALRATGAELDSTRNLWQTLQELGQPLYKKAEPTGYYVTAEEWTSSAALLARMNFGLALARNDVKGVRIPTAATWRGQKEPEQIAEALLLQRPSAQLLEVLREQKNADPARVAGLVLGGPEFQRR